MHSVLAVELLKTVRARIAEGDRPTADPLSTETLEGLADELGRRADRAERALGFFASVIKSGEPWTETCQREYDAVFGRPEPPTAGASRD